MLNGSDAMALSDIYPLLLEPLLRVSADTPRSRANSQSGFLEERASFTASALNSGGYGGLVLSIRTPFWDAVRFKSKGVN